jgi:hypothetical protein
MITPKELAEAFARNLNIIMSQTKGLNHADSVLQPPIRGNCMNWVLGHIVDNRNTVLLKLDRLPMLSEAQGKRYGYGSEPVCADGEDVLKLEDLLSMLKSSQETINAALDRITPEDLAREIQGFRGSTPLGSFLFFLCWHETYHLGQLEILRQLAGTNDKVI